MSRSKGYTVLIKIKDQVVTLLTGQGPIKKNGLIGFAAVLLTGAIVLSLWRANQGYVALYGAAENLPTAQVVDVLSGENIAYRINPDNGQILVVESALPKARMALAAKGIVAVLPDGYELMDKEEMLGSSQFIQNVRYKRSLEGELAKSITGLDPVESARVHLGISEASSFVMSNRPESSASVIVQLRYGQTLDENQVLAIVQFVSGSVPGMKASSVRVVDQRGNLLSENIQDGSIVAGIRKATEVTQRIKLDTESNVSALLASLVGQPNFRVSVAPQVEISSVEESQETLGKDPHISNENLNQENTTNELALGVPGSLSNRPVNQTPANQGQDTNAPGTAAAPESKPQSLSSRSQEQRQYTYDRYIRHIRGPGYQLVKLRVAVALNQTAASLANITPEKLASLTRLIEDSAGIDKDRGDSLTLNVMPFIAPEAPETPVVKWWQDPDIQYWGRMGGFALLALLVLLFAVRPLIRGLRARNPQEETVPALDVVVDDSAVTNSIASDLGLAKSSFQNDDNLPPQGSGLETKVEYLQMLAKSETERVAEVLKQWINSNERSSSRAGQ